MMLDGCPKKQVDSATRETLSLLEYAHDGMFPIAGGIRDQSSSFLDALDYYDAILNKFESSNHHARPKL